MNKIDATILSIIYHPEIRHVLTEQGKKDIAEMVRTLTKGLCPFLRCEFVDRCNALCDWAKDGMGKSGESVH